MPDSLFQPVGRDAATVSSNLEIEHVGGADESVHRQLVELLPLRPVVPWRIHVGSRVADEEEGLGQEAVDLAPRPWDQDGPWVRGEHLEVGANLLAQVHNAIVLDGVRPRILGGRGSPARLQVVTGRGS